MASPSKSKSGSPCDRCGQPADRRVAETGVERWVCADCAEILSGRLGLVRLATALSRPKRRHGVCPHCGANEEDARRTGLVGCPLCYVAFDDAFWQSIGIPRSRWSRGDLW